MPSTGYAVEEGQSWTFSNPGVTESWIAPVSGQYKIEAWGAQGGSLYDRYYDRTTPGGKGAYSTGTVPLSPTKPLTIRAGKGAGTGSSAGGDGSYVALAESNTPLVVAGGGGGYGHKRGTSIPGGDGDGTIGTSMDDGKFKNSSSDKHGVGRGFTNGCLGGTPTTYFGDSVPGAGGGYSGGDVYVTDSWYSSDDSHEAFGTMGGTSFRMGTNLAGSSGVREGHGLVKITLVTITDEAHLLGQVKTNTEQIKNDMTGVKSSADQAKTNANTAATQATQANTNASIAASKAQTAIDQTTYNNKSAAQWAAESANQTTNINNKLIGMDNDLKMVKDVVTSIRDNDYIPPSVSALKWVKGKTATTNNVEILLVDVTDNKTLQNRIKYQYRVNEGQFSPEYSYSPNLSINLGTDKGLKIIDVRFIDESGNVATIKTSIWKI